MCKHRYLDFTYAQRRDSVSLRASNRRRIMIGFEAYLKNDSGMEIVPGDKADWREWVSASKTRNWCRKDPLLDWLNLFGAEKG